MSVVGAVGLLAVTVALVARPMAGESRSAQASLAQAPVTRLNLPYVERRVRPTTVPPDELPELEVEAQVGGTAYGVAVAGGLAYLASGTVLKVADVTNPALPRWLGQSRPLPGLAVAVVLNPPWAYVAISPGRDPEGIGGLAVMALAPPAMPRLDRFLALSNGAIHAVRAGDFLYVLCRNPLGDSGSESGGVVRVLDLAEPAVPQEVAEFNTDGTWRLAVEGTRLYVGSSVIDISNPRRPMTIDDAYVPVHDASLAVKDGLVAFTGTPSRWSYEESLGVTDTSFNPERSVECWPGASLHAVDWIGDRLLAVGRDVGCRVTVPVTDALTARPFDSPGWSTALAQDAGLAFAAHQIDPIDESAPGGELMTGGGLRVLNPSAAAGSPVLSTLAGPPARSMGVAAHGERIYLLDDSFEGQEDGPWPARLWVLDGRDPSSPVPLGWVGVAGRPFGVGADERHAYVASHRGLEVFDVRDPTQPVALGWAAADFSFGSVPMPAFRVLAAGGQVFVATGRGLAAFDLRDPTRPRPLPVRLPDPYGGLGPADFCLGPPGFGFALVGNLVVPLRIGSAGVEPAGSELELPSQGTWPASLAYAKGHLFLLLPNLDETVSLLVLDATDPEHLKQVASLPALPNWPLGFGSFYDMPGRLTTDGQRLVVSGANASISVVDMLEPAWPQVTSLLRSTLMDHAVIQQFGQDSRYPGLKDPLIWFYDAAVFGQHVLRTRVPGGLEVLRMP